MHSSANTSYLIQHTRTWFSHIVFRRYYNLGSEIHFERGIQNSVFRSEQLTVGSTFIITMRRTEGNRFGQKRRKKVTIRGDRKCLIRQIYGRFLEARGPSGGNAGEIRGARAC